MKDQYKTKKQLIEELEALRKQVVKLKRLEAKQRQVEEALRKSEERFATIFRNSPVGISVTTIPDGRIVDVNESILYMLGYCREEVIGHTSVELNIWANPEERARAMKLLREQRTVRNLEVSFHTKSGEIRQGLTSFELIVLDGKPHLLAMTHDITERKQAEEILRETQMRLGLAVKAANVGLWDWNLKTNKVFYSREWKRQIGYEDQEISNDFSEWQSRVHPDDLDHLLSTIQAYLKNPWPNYEVEFRLRHKDGSYRWILTQASLLMDNDGKPYRMLGSHVDITERKQVEEELRQSEERFSKVFHASPVSITITRLSDGLILDVNESLLRMLGYHREEVIGHTSAELNVWDNPDERKKVVQLLREKGSIHDIEISFRTKLGEIRQAFTSLELLVLGGEPCLLSLAHDITDRKRAEEALHEKEQILSESQRIAHIGSWLYDITGQILWSDETYNIYGVSPDNFTPNAESFLNLIHPDDRPAMQAWINACLAGEKPGELEFRSIMPDGTVRFISGCGELKYDAENKPIHMAGTAQDITERKQAGEKIFRLNRLYSVLSKINEAIVRIHEPEKLYNEVCKIAVEDGLFHMVWLGLVDQNTLLVKPVTHWGVEEGYLDKIHISINPDVPEGRGPTGTAIREGKYFVCNDIENDPRMLPWRDEALKRGYRSSAAFPLKAGKMTIGTINLYKNELYFFENEEEEVRLLMSLTDDLSFAIEYMENEEKRQRAEESLRRSEAFLDNIIEQSPHAMYITDGRGTLMRLNQTCRELLHITDDEVVGKYNVLQDNIVEEQGLLPLVKKVFEKGETVKFTIWYDSSRLKPLELRKTAFVTLDVTISPVLDVNGRVTNAITQHVDITERKRAEDQLRSSREQLRALSAHLQSVREEERTLIAREIHDELGQTLTVFKMDLSWLENKLPKKEKSLIEKAQSMSKLIDSTIQLVRKISTKLRPGVLDDLGLIAAIEWQAQEFQDRTGIKCEFNSSLETVELDRERSTAVFRICQETLTNVARHSDATRVIINVEESAGNLTLEVDDNGKGISESEISNPKSLGLLGMKERAHIFGGELNIVGTHGKGTTVMVSIPIQKK